MLTHLEIGAFIVAFAAMFSLFILIMKLSIRTGSLQTQLESMQADVSDIQLASLKMADFEHELKEVKSNFISEALTVKETVTPPAIYVANWKEKKPETVKLIDSQSPATKQYMDERHKRD